MCGSSELSVRHSSYSDGLLFGVTPVWRTVMLNLKWYLLAMVIAASAVGFAVMMPTSVLADDCINHFCAARSILLSPYQESSEEVVELHSLYTELGCVDIWCIMDTCQRLNYAMNNGRKSLNFCAHAQTSTLERRTIAGATSRPSCGWHEVVLLGDCCLSTTVTGTAYISASHAGVKRVYGNECISILCKTPIWSMSSLIAL